MSHVPCGIPSAVAEFSGDIDAVIDYVALSIGNKYVSYQYDSIAKVTYFMLYNKESAKKSINTPIEYNEVVVELYQTLNNKNEELISKENIDRFTEFNSIKQPEKRNLKLLAQPIYANSSCPPKPNFKKKWDNSNENYTENNVLVAVIDMDLVNELPDNTGLNDAEM
ncbi:hypothetical protein BB561_002272 [Smittium simulii]|uniref:Uncharacterized protein n=1 Tax=Smittium simulii TaxID=133385 RepID=A0A2T9YR41_9FUNG|nr:hypothetical protein BB561_002272 [Smittium simulii]